MTQWEYRIITLITEAGKDQTGHHETTKERNQRVERSLSEMGKDGWELVMLVPTALKGAYSDPWMYDAIFKRPCED